MTKLRVYNYYLFLVPNYEFEFRIYRISSYLLEIFNPCHEFRDSHIKMTARDKEKKTRRSLLSTGGLSLSYGFNHGLRRPCRITVLYHSLPYIWQHCQVDRINATKVEIYSGTVLFKEI